MSSATITYDPVTRNQIMTYDNGTVVTATPEGVVLSQTMVNPPTTPGGPPTTSTITYTARDDHDPPRPTAGYGPDGPFTIRYDESNGNSIMTLDGGATVYTTNAQGQLVETTVTSPTGEVVTTTYSAWDEQKRPIAGSGPDGPFTLGYQNGNTVMTLDGGATVYTSDAQGQLVETTVTSPTGEVVTTTYSAWDEQKRPIAGSGPDGAFTLGYQNGNTVMTLDGGATVYTSDAQGQLVETTVTSPTGEVVTTTYSAWDDQKRPIAGSGPDGAFTLGYQNGNTVMTLDGGATVYTTNAQGQLVETTVTSPTGEVVTTTYSAWDDQKRPIAGSGPDGAFTLGYQNGNTVMTLDGGATVYTTNAQGQLVETTVTSPTGEVVTTTYSAWDDQKRPIAGSGPDGAFTLGYQNGNTVMTLDGGATVYTTNAQGQLVETTVTSPTGEVVTTTYSAWDDQKRPTAGTGPDGAFTLGYQNGNTVMTLDGGATVYTTNAQGQLVETTVTSPTGEVVTTTYSAWDDQKRPTAGTGPDGPFTLGYQNGNTVMTLDGGATVYTTNAQGQLVETTVTSPTGEVVTTTYSAWDDQKRPTAGTGPDGPFTLGYQNGNTVMTLDGGATVYTTNAQGQLVETTVTSPTGEVVTTTYSAWDDQKRPTAGTGPDGPFTLMYVTGNTVTLGDGSTVTIANAQGELTVMKMDDGSAVYVTNAQGNLLSTTTRNDPMPWDPSDTPVTYTTTTYSAWDDQKRPTAGTGSEGAFTIAYAPNGNSITTFTNGTVITAGPDGTPVEIKVPIEGKPGQYTTYTSFTDKGWPTGGTDPDGNFTITYDLATGDQTIKYTDGPAKGTTHVLTDDGKLISTTTPGPDGEFIDWAVELGELYAATAKFPKYVEEIGAQVKLIAGDFNLTKEAWRSAVSGSFDTATSKFNTDAAKLASILAEANNRLRTTYLNIVNTETINAQNMPKILPPNPL